jgi:hypothetical protein
MKRIVTITSLLFLLSFDYSSFAQVKLEDIPFDLNEILDKSKVLKVKKGFSPVFSLANYQINGVGILGEKLKGIEILGDIFNTKHVDDIKKLYKTYKTGLVVFKVMAVAGTAVATYSTVRGLTADGKFSSQTVRQTLYPALGTMATGVITKILTKKASYKAVDTFNGIITKKIKDILSVAPASSGAGVALYVQL